MMKSVQSTTRLVVAAFRALLVLTVVTGVLYPLAITGVAQGAFHDKANGSMIKVDGKEVGSELIGQTYNLPAKEGEDPKPDPRFFQGRPSNSGYDPLATGSSQLGTSDAKLVKMVGDAKKQVAAFNTVPGHYEVEQADVPKDAVTGSASAIDPHISKKYAEIQVERVAKHNGLTAAQVAKLVKDNTEGRTFGFLGEPHVNVLKLNIAVQKLAKG
ncbi:potassium-transporting ATPase subunit C [Streptomyces sp. XD-27]|uniref:potassium-transporting ATPase subunit C n=1 Tax=Streptomyces sp. XD-27 TaxID=3062779 RepID=UPI0026F477F8|nr:potassium-transporting ATPase subunit C [Streptomyces sp. XD-27]WKX73031.1 potassium-transporting ATPase subunit C [Streptomyces sp. XD-27]